MLYTLLLIIHVLISVALVLVILAQSSKGGGLDSNLGGTAQSIFGGGGGTSAFLRKWTRILGGLFLISCVVLALTVNRKQAPSTRIMDKLKKETAQQAPVSAPVKAAPAPTAPVQTTPAAPTTK